MGEGASKNNQNETRLERFIAKWQGKEGGQERANYALFLSQLCDVLGVAEPDPATATTEQNDYVFERSVDIPNPDGSVSKGRIDLYKRGSFVLEAKQSRLKGGTKEIAGQSDIFGADTAKERGRRGAGKSWDVLMMNARTQAQGYARALPTAHGWPPFILVCDVGHVIEVYADFSGQGKNYGQFPDRTSFRIYLEDLRDPKVRARLVKIWTDPMSLDPARESARVTREIAERLAAVSKALEKTKKYKTEDVAMFLMRCLFTMFAEDVELLPKASFEKLLIKCEKDPSKFQPMVTQLWEAMDTGGFAYALETDVKRFNGEFFKSRAAEEAKGQVRWLRPDYQIPRFGSAKEKKELDLVGGEMREGVAVAEKKQNFPAEEIAQTAAVMSVLMSASAPLGTDAIASTFKQGRKVSNKVGAVLTALARMGYVNSADGGRTFALRKAA